MPRCGNVLQRERGLRRKFYGSSTHFLVKYILFAAISIVATVPFVMFMRLWHWRVFGAVAYIASVIMLVLVVIIGVTGGGAQRWIAIGPITVQPSEIAKMAVIMVLALYMSKHEKEVTSTHKFGGNFKHGVLAPMLIIGIVAVLSRSKTHIRLMIVGMIDLPLMFCGHPSQMAHSFCLRHRNGGGGAYRRVRHAQDRVNIWLHIEQVDARESVADSSGLYAIGSGGFTARVSKQHAEVRYVPSRRTTLFSQ